MRPYICACTLIFLLFSTTAQSQTRFFEKGDSGFIPSIGLYAKLRSSDKFEWDWKALASYTHHGLFDVGAGYENSYHGAYLFFADIVVIQPKGTRGLGLDLGGQYWTQSWELRYRPPLIQDRRTHRIYTTALRGFYRNAPANLVTGLGAVYKFNKFQTLDTYDEVLYGHDFGEWGFVFDCNFLAWRLVHFSVEAEYSQNNLLPHMDDWSFKFFLGAGFMIGLNQETGGGR